MPRRGNVPKRDVLPDPVYGSKVVAKLINQIMLDGNKATAQKIVYDAFDMMKEKLGKEPMEIFNQAMANVMPVLEVKARRVGGANYQVPIEIRPERSTTRAARSRRKKIPTAWRRRTRLSRISVGKRSGLCPDNLVLT